MPTRDIRTRLSLDGEMTYKQALSEMSKGLSVLNSELRLNSEQFKGNEDSIEALTSKGVLLEQKLLSQRDKVDLLRQAYEKSAQKNGESSAKTQDLRIKLNDAERALIGMDRELKQNTTALDESTKKNIHFNDALDGAKDKARGYGSVIGDLAGKFGISLPDEITKGLDSLGELDGGLYGVAGGGVAALSGAIIALGATVIKETAEANLALEELAINMKIALGLTKEEADDAKKSIESLYLGGIVEGREDAEKALVAVMRLMNASGDEAEDYASQIALIKKVWGEDFAETARTASTLMKTFGITGQEALDLIVTGLQTSANKNGDLLDVLNEYSPAYKRIGDSAETFLMRVVAATDAGAYSADKAADAYKEFYNRAASDSDAFNAGLEELHLNSNLITDAVLSGGSRAQDAIGRVIERLDGVGSEADKARIASALFGSQWEDVGTDAVIAMSNVRGAVLDTTNATTDAMEEMTSTASSAWEKVWREFKHNTFNWKSIVQLLTGVPLNSILQPFDTAGKNAEGTNNWRGGLTWVGEQGPELVNLPSGSQVVPARRSASIAGGNYTLNVYPRDMMTVARMTATFENARQKGRAK